MRDCRTKARLMLIAYAGFRPSEIMRGQSEDVLRYLDLPEPFCFKRVGKGGVPVMVHRYHVRALQHGVSDRRKGWVPFKPPT